jgi:hypothetical protein
LEGTLATARATWEPPSRRLWLDTTDAGEIDGFLKRLAYPCNGGGAYVELTGWRGGMPHFEPQQLGRTYFWGYMQYAFADCGHVVGANGREASLVPSRTDMV